MKSSKEKRIKEIKKIHIFPHIVILTVFIFVFTAIIFAISELFVSILLVNHLEGSYQNAQEISTMIEQQIEDGDISSIELISSGDYGIYDNESQEFVISPKQDIDLENVIVLDLDDKIILIDRINGERLDGLFIDEQSVYSILFKSISAEELVNIIENNNYDVDVDLANVHGWIKNNIVNDKYAVYYSADVVLKIKDLGYITGFLSILIIFVSIPLIMYIVMLVINIVGQRRAAKILYYDPITGGKNWIYFSKRARKIVKKCKGEKRRYAMVSLRMDRYQGYCACYGIAEGEVVIENINNVLDKNLKRKELFARYAEAEFGILISMDSPEQVVDRLNSIKSQLVTVAKSHKIDFAYGLCEVSNKSSVDELYSSASLARKSIPVNSTDKYLWFNDQLKEDQLWERFVEENMEHALETGELHVYLQPKYNAETRRLGGAEALIRWINPDKGFIGPGKFIPIFEKNGFITKIDDFMLRSVARLQANWVKEERNIVPISVNISRAHFTQEDLAEHIYEIVESEGAPKELIELELTESAFFEDKDILINTVGKLKSMGFSISMDDFGAGYSSLNSLKDLKLDVLKIDADFFRGKEENEERGSMIVSETIQLAKNLGMTTVAEGIESAEQVEFLAEKGCDLIQGFYFAKPMPVADYELKMQEDAEANQVD